MKYDKKNYEGITAFSDRELERFESIYGKYRRMHLEPRNATPMFIVNTPVERHSWEEKLENPGVMLEDDLRVIRAHADLGDDRVPSTRVSFGTAQIAAAFGCGIFLPPDNLPCAKDHVLDDIGKVRHLEKPGRGDGWYGKLFRFSEFYLENMPEGVQLQMPDIQSTFNNAHLIRGNDIIFDFYDNPEKLGILLDIVTDYMIDLVPILKPYTTDFDEWFFDWGCLWKGRARISNCSAHLISPAMYRDFVYERDRRLIESIGGGRVHYCGSYPEVIENFAKIPGLSGFDYDDSLHPLERICGIVPEEVPVFCWAGATSPTVQKLLSGNWPDKGNIIIGVDAKSAEEGADILKRLRKAAERHYERLY
jgi:hypothetical protein